MSIYEVIERMKAVLLYVQDHPDRAWSIFLYKTCRPLWRYFYRRRIKQQEKETNSIRLPLQLFRQMVKEKWGDTIRIAVRNDCVEIIEIETEKVVFTLPVERNDTGTVMVVWPNDLAPDRVKAAAAQYRQENDVIAQWLDECCKIEPEAFTTVDNAYTNYQDWSKANGYTFAVNKKRFSQRLADKGYISEQRRVKIGNVSKNQRVYVGFTTVSQ